MTPRSRVVFLFTLLTPSKSLRCRANGTFGMACYELLYLLRTLVRCMGLLFEVDGFSERDAMDLLIVIACAGVVISSCALFSTQSYHAVRLISPWTPPLVATYKHCFCFCFLLCRRRSLPPLMMHLMPC